MKLAQKYLTMHIDEYANFGYKDRPGTYSEPGIEKDKAIIYGEICMLEGQLSILNTSMKVIEDKKTRSILSTVIEALEYDIELIRKKENI